MDATEKLRAMLDERGIKWKKPNSCAEFIMTTWGVGPWEYEACDTTHGEIVLRASHKDWLTPEQAIAATVGTDKREPSKEWRAWHNSLRHDNPTSIREAVENILYEAIDFGNNMGPNGNVWSGIDEGAVLTKNRINGWVKSVESIASTVGGEPNESTMLELHNRMNAAALGLQDTLENHGNVIPHIAKMHEIIEDAATVGACEVKRTVYVLRADDSGYHGELGCIIGIFSSKEKAEAAMSDIPKGYVFPYIEERVMDE